MTQAADAKLETTVLHDPADNADSESVHEFLQQKVQKLVQDSSHTPFGASLRNFFKRSNPLPVVKPKVKTPRKTESSRSKEKEKEKEKKRKELKRINDRKKEIQDSPVAWS